MVATNFRVSPQLATWDLEGSRLFFPSGALLCQVASYNSVFRCQLANSPLFAVWSNKVALALIFLFKQHLKSALHVKFCVVRDPVQLHEQLEVRNFKCAFVCEFMNFQVLMES